MVPIVSCTAARNDMHATPALAQGGMARRSYIFRSVYQIDMKFDRRLRPATETSWVVSYGGKSCKTIPRWRTAANLNIVISPSVENHPIFIKFCTQQQILNWVTWTGWTSRDQKWKSCIGQTPSSTERISCCNIQLSCTLISFSLCKTFFNPSYTKETVFQWPTTKAAGTDVQGKTSLKTLMTLLYHKINY